MARFPINEALCEAILAEPKVIREDIRWSTKSNKSWARTQVEVHGKFQGHLTLAGNVNLEHPSKYGFSLLLNGIRIRGLDVRGNHKNT